SPVPSRLAKKDRFSEQNTSKTLKNRRLWTGTSLARDAGGKPHPLSSFRPEDRHARFLQRPAKAGLFA
ncbi:hypothetical protein, partial [Sinorhizobium meliloti]|uniref:hypothetical protein n=1 Tax=Rhizobium meliloti TaxID=382 RepID=UPI000FDB8096